MVDRLDLATARAIQYAKSLNVDDVRAVHFAIDVPRAQALEDRWVRLGMSRLALELVECPDRRVVRAALEMADEAAADGQTEVSVLLPRRSYTLAWNRLLHDSVGERIAAAVSRLEHVNATIVPFDVEGELRDRRRGERGSPVVPPTEGDEREQSIDARVLGSVTGTTPIPALHARQHARVAGRVRSLTVQPWGDVPTLQVQLTDDQGRLDGGVPRPASDRRAGAREPDCGRRHRDRSPWSADDDQPGLRVRCDAGRRLMPAVVDSRPCRLSVRTDYQNEATRLCVSVIR